MEEGALAKLGQILREARARQIFLVVDEIAWEHSGAGTVLKNDLQSVHVTRFSNFEPNPKIEDVERGVALCRVAKPDLIVAFGGGTALDVAKMIGAMQRHPSSPRQIALKGLPFPEGSIPVVAIPTTAGTGSEATHFAVVYVDGQKYSIAASCLLPRWAMIDSQLTYSVPAPLTAATGLDAFCQAIESIWAVGATDESIGYAVEAARLAKNNLAEATHRATPRSRGAMCQAAHLAGKAINVSKTTLPHAISYALTSDYGIPHGLAVATTLSSVLAFNYEITEEDCTDPRGVQHVRNRLALVLQLLDATDVETACENVERWIQNINGYPTLAAAGITNDDQIRAITRRVNLERLANNPRRAHQEQLVALLRGRQTKTASLNRAATSS
ncbi:iron-containing alcohol dehydrogenase [Bremerella cremea]|uniref:Iron-containing alcohol dehydrogenase n=2 Tax=Bremerella cremea TaxID=1031537 RepID=A0A368KWR7_9BACT|nr:iron-containing alcohol dehydrogenase [Bremerella cremea]